MKFREAILTCFRKFADFSGRASRSEYWYFTLFVALGFLLFGIIFQTEVLALGFALATFVPHIAVACRRAHDSGLAASFLAWPLGISVAAAAISIANRSVTFPSMEIGISAEITYLASSVFIIYVLSRRTQITPNKYGPNPLEVTP